MRQQRSRFHSPQGPYSPYPSPIGHPYPPALNHGLPIISSSSEPASPYFLNQQDNDASSPYVGYHQATPEDFLQPPSKVAGFEFMPLRSNEGLFGDQDPELATPGMTDASFDE